MRTLVTWITLLSVTCCYHVASEAAVPAGRSVSGIELKEAMILSIAHGNIVDLSRAPGAASPASCYRMDIVRMIRDRRLNGDDEEADLLEQDRAAHPELFIA